MFAVRIPDVSERRLSSTAFSERIGFKTRCLRCVCSENRNQILCVHFADVDVDEVLHINSHRRPSRVTEAIRFDFVPTTNLR